jgi:hypothetical protein
MPVRMLGEQGWLLELFDRFQEHFGLLKRN